MIIKMSMWFTNPINFIKNPSSLVVVNSFDNGLNFLTLCCVALSYYMKSLNNPMWKNFLIFSIIIIITLGVLITKEQTNSNQVRILPNNQAKPQSRYNERDITKSLIV